MRVGHNAAALGAYKGVRLAADQLFNSLRRLSSGERIERPGDAPAEYGISEQLRFQIQNSQTASRNLANARSLIGTADSWLQVSHDILSRMSELAVSAKDASKGTGDLEALNTEYLQLKEELSRIGRSAEYNGVQVAGRDHILSYDQDRETFFFSQLNGKEKYYLNRRVLSGIKGTNQEDFLFDASKDYTMSPDGRFVVYVDSNDNLTRFDIEEGTVTRDTADSEDKGLDVDGEGRLWYARETAPASGTYSLRAQDISTWVQDTDLMGNTDITDMASSEFSVYDGRVYYLDTNGDFVSRAIQNVNDVHVEVDSSEYTLTNTAGQFAVSEDGLFVADMPSAGNIRVINTETLKSNTFAVEAGVTVDSLKFSADNHDLLYVDTVDGSIHHLGMDPANQPMFQQDVKIHDASGTTGFAGLSLDGSSHRGRFRLQHGPDSGQELFFETGDVRLHTLQLSRTSLESKTHAARALEKLDGAVANLALQRSTMGAQESRIMQTFHAMHQYTDSLSQADSVLREADMAKEAADMADYQVRYQAATAILAQANQSSSSVLQLLRR